MLINEYNLRYVEADVAAHGGWMESDDDHGHERSSLEDCLVPASWGYAGAVEYYKLDETVFLYDEVRTNMGEPAVNEPTTELGARILADGHPVVEYTVSNIYSGSGGSQSLTFKYVSTRLDGIWYIAEIISQ